MEFILDILIRMVNADMIDPDWTTAYIFNFDPDINYVETTR